MQYPAQFSSTAFNSNANSKIDIQDIDSSFPIGQYPQEPKTALTKKTYQTGITGITNVTFATTQI